MNDTYQFMIKESALNDSGIEAQPKDLTMFIMEKMGALLDDMIAKYGEDKAIQSFLSASNGMSYLVSINKTKQCLDIINALRNTIKAIEEFQCAKEL